MKKLHLFFTILLMLGIGLLSPLQAQTQMVKTLDDPGSMGVTRATINMENQVSIQIIGYYVNDGRYFTSLNLYAISPGNQNAFYQAPPFRYCFN